MQRPSHLDVVFIHLLAEVIHIHLSVQGKGGRTLHQALNLSPTKIFCSLCTVLTLALGLISAETMILMLNLIQPRHMYSSCYIDKDCL